MTNPLIGFSGRVQEELPDDVRSRLKEDLVRVFQKLGPTRPVEAITVPQCLGGHTPDYAAKVVLAVEVRYPDGYERHIVKVGRRAKVEADFEGWQACTGGRMVAGRIFAPVRKCPLPDERFAVVYRDAFTLAASAGSGTTPQQGEAL
jgi:hypothetical protein